MKTRILIGMFICAIFSLVLIEPALAGPGGKIASAAFGTFWGRILLAALTVFFLPLIIYVLIREKIAERRTRRDLAFMARRDPLFNWMKIQERVKDCFYRVHSGWRDEDLSNIVDWMTDWYWQNQQLVFLDKWKRENLVNICDVKKISDIRPLLFVHNNDKGIAHENSMVVVSISADMKDYLQDRITGDVVEGDKRYKNVETIWSFTLENGVWKVSDIESGDMSMAYAKAGKDLPDIEATLIERQRA